ncbi:MAG: gamma-glutamylcyclotransferase [Kiloniellales bacterium]
MPAPDLPRLPAEAIAAHRRTLAPPPGKDLWVFGYGSLMWSPGFPHIEVLKARLRGYHRRFCVYSFRYRGTPDCPGLVLGLDRGGSCWGLAYRVPAGEVEAALDYLLEREMVTGVYRSRRVSALAEGRSLEVATFVVDPAHRQYAGRLDEAELVRLIRQGTGQMGPCGDYLRNTVRHLETLGLHDHALHRILRLVDGAAKDAAQPKLIE